MYVCACVLYGMCASCAHMCMYEEVWHCIYCMYACVHVYECTYEIQLLTCLTCVPLQIHSFSATDMDIGPNANLTYRIEQVATVPPGMGDYSSSFSLGGKSTTP